MKKRKKKKEKQVDGLADGTIAQIGEIITNFFLKQI
jgi:hypothetical protein